MQDNIIEMLRLKEEEMEAFIDGAWKKAEAVREGAHKRAKEIREAGLSNLEDELKAMDSAIDDSIRDEVGRMDDEAEAGIRLLKARVAHLKSAAIEDVLRLISEGVDDREDDEGPDNRAKGTPR